MSKRITLEGNGLSCKGTLRRTDNGLFIDIDSNAPDECGRVFERNGFRVRPKEREDDDY